MIKNSAIHNGQAWAIWVTASSNFVFEDNVVYNHRNWGIRFDQVTNAVVDRNIVMQIKERTTFVPAGMECD